MKYMIFASRFFCAPSRDESAQKITDIFILYIYRLIHYMIVCVFMLSIAIKNLLYFLYHGSREHTKFKSTNFYRIIKSFVTVRNDAYARKKGTKCIRRWEKSLKQHFSTFSIFISFYSNGSAKKL